MQLTPTSYRLSLHPRLEVFRSELEFACGFLDQCHDIARSESGSATVVHYGPEPPTDAIHIPNVLFPNGVMIDAEGIHPNFDNLRQLEAGIEMPPLLPTASDNQDKPGGSLAYDALGLIFLMLSRLEERDSEARQADRYSRFPFEGSLQARHGNLETPYADIAAKDIAGAILGTDEPASLTKYNVLLTHDVDRFRGLGNIKFTMKIIIGDIVFRKDLVLAVKRLWDALAIGEPWRSCRYVMRNAEQYGLVCRFFFMGPTENRMDSPYALRWPGKLRRLAKVIVSRGHKVGFHPGAATFKNQSEWDRQRTGLEKIIEMNVSEGRQHALMFQIDATWDIWDQAGMAKDMTLGYPNPSGFRSGTCRSHPVYSLRQRRTLSLRSYPTAIMDFGLFDGKYRDLTLDAALAECQRIIDVCKIWGGDLVVLYHPAQLSNLRRKFFERLLERL
jgi:hypothetical protein